MSPLKIHHLNCATMCPVGLGLTDRETFVCHCLLVETNQGLVLIDTGLGMGDVTAEPALPWLFRAGLRPTLTPEETAVRQVEALGFDPADVRHIVLTHLHVDHAGGLTDFPEATVHVHTREHRDALGELSRKELVAYRPCHWAHEPQWQTYEPTGEPWFGFEAVRDLSGLPPEILIIPLSGHTPGHSGVAIDTENGWMLHAGDAYFHTNEIHGAGDPPRLIRAFQHFNDVDKTSRNRNQKRLRELAETGEVQIFCAHDEVEFRHCCGG